MENKQKKEYIVDNVNELSLEDKGGICAILIQNGRKKNIIYNKDGGCVNLDILDDSVINSLYAFVEYKMKKINTTF